MELLSHALGFEVVPPEARSVLADLLEESRFPAGSVVVTEGEASDGLYLVAEGRAQASTRSSEGPVTLAWYGPGEIFGEISLVLPSTVRNATVTAITLLVTLKLSAGAFRLLLDRYPNAREIVEAAAHEMLLAKFLSQATNFSSLSPPQARWLASQLRPLSVPSGVDIVRQGETGDVCYLLRAGCVEVLAAIDGMPPRRIATQGPGAIVGETALLTGEPRNATVRALEPCDLLVLRREDFLEALRSDAGVTAAMAELLILRDRPRQAPQIEAYHRSGPGEQRTTVLKDPQRGVYYRLSPEGWFIWQRLDGRHYLRDLTIEYFAAFGGFVPEAIAGVIRSLAAAGFVQTKALPTELGAQAQERSAWGRALVMAKRVLEWNIALGNVDSAVTRLYKGGLRFL